METIQEQQEQKKKSIYTAEEEETIQRMKEAIPNWHAILFEGKRDKNHDIGNSMRCVVGEWYGHDK